MFIKIYSALALILLMGSFLQNFHTLPWNSAHSEALAFLAILTWGWGAASRNAGKVCLNIPIVALLCVSLFITLQFATGNIIFLGDAVLLLLYVQLCLGTLIIAQENGEDVDWPNLLALTMLFSSLVSALVAFAQALGLWVGSEWILQLSGFRRPGANLGQPNQLGTLLVMGAASLIYLRHRLHISLITTVLLSIWLLLGMAATESRTGLISSLILCLWWFIRREKLPFASRWHWILVSVLFLVVVMWVWPVFISYIHEAGPLPKRVSINTSAGVRLNVWMQLWEAVWIKPWLGWGLRGVSNAHNLVVHSYSQSAPFSYAHNILLDMAIGAGLPLTLFALTLVSIWGSRRVRAAQTVVSWYAVGLLVPLVTHSMLEYPFAYAYFLIPGMFAVGFLEKNYAQPASKMISQKIIFGSLIIFSFLFAWVVWEYVNIEEDFRVARFEALNVGHTAPDYQHPNIVLLTQLKAMLVATRTSAKLDMSHEEIEKLRLATLRFPWIPIQNCYALSLALNGNSQEALRQLKVIRAMHGEKAYEKIHSDWMELARTTYPQLAVFRLP